ncbi:MAG: LamG domain-containing protein, partial [Planctomycetales bacterium]|nr:LamG domain-containing protein [Planctomycetales bacterium]
MSLRILASLLVTAIALPASAATIAYFDFEEGTDGAVATTVTDTGDGTNNLTIGTAAPSYSGATLPVATPSGSTLAMDFDSGEHLEVANLGTSSWVTGAYSDFTLEAWVYFSDTLGSWQTMIGRDDTGNPGEGTAANSLLYFSKHDADWLRVELITASNTLIAVDPGAAFAVSPNVWYHMAAVGDSTAGTLSLYVNGSMTGQTTGYDGLYDPGTDTTWSLGRGQYAGNDADNFNGLLDDVRFSNVALDPGQFLYVPPSFLWTADSDGVFSDSTKWENGSVPGAGDSPTFGDAITANRTVTLDSSVSLNSVTFNNSGDGDYFIVPAASETLTLTGDAEVNTTGRHWLRAPVAGTAGLNTTGGGELVLDAVNTFSGGLNVGGTNVAVVNDGAIPAGNAITLQGAGDLRFYGASNGFFTGQGSAGFGTGTINDAVTVSNGSILGVFDGVDLTLAGPVTANGVLSADNATLTISGATTFDISDNNVSGSIVGGGTVNLNGAFAINTGSVTDTLGGWTLVNVNTLTETYGAGFSVTGYTENDGIWTSGAYAFNEATGLLSVGDVWAVD